MMDDVAEVQRALLHRIQTEGVQTAYEAALAVCRNPNAPAPAKATAAATLFRVAGYFDRKDQSNRNEPHEMSPEELQSEIKRLEQLGKRRLPNIFE